MTGNMCVSKNNIDNTSQVRSITWVGMIVNIVLVALKFIAGVLGYSQALIADAFHSLSDLSTDIAIIFGVKFWSAPADDNHPYGHGRIETIITAALGIVLAVVGIGILYNSLTTIQEFHTRHPGRIAFIGAVISIISKELLYHWTVAVGRKINSSAVIANAWHHRSDAFSSIPVAIAVIVAIINPKWSFVDHLGAIIVSLFILHASWKIMKSSLFELSDSSVQKDICEEIEKIVLSGNKEIKEVHAIRARKLGAGVYVDLHILVDKNMSVLRGHDIAEAVKQKLINNGPNIMDVIVHIEPYTAEQIK